MEGPEASGGGAWAQVEGGAPTGPLDWVRQPNEPLYLRDDLVMRCAIVVPRKVLSSLFMGDGDLKVGAGKGFQRILSGEG